MNNEEKILEMLQALTGKVDSLTDTAEKHSETLARHSEILARNSEILTQHSEVLAQHSETLSELQKTVTRVAVTQENIVLKSLDAMAEGQDLTHQRLKDLAGKEELTDLKEEVRLLRSVVAQHSRDIEALKAAQ